MKKKIKRLLHRIRGAWLILTTKKAVLVAKRDINKNECVMHVYAYGIDASEATNMLINGTTISVLADRKITQDNMDDAVKTTQDILNNGSNV